MSTAQEAADVIAMALSLIEDEDAARYIEIMKGYATSDSMNNPVVKLNIATAMMTILAQLIDATADYLEMTPDELGNFLLIEKFKRELFDG